MPIDELVVLSHLRWDWVWQRPQHLISRIAKDTKTWFIEEPLPSRNVAEATLRTEEHGSMTRVWLEVPVAASWVGFDDLSAETYGDELAELLPAPTGERAVWLYTPVALPLAQGLEPSILIYDVMDDLASFKNASTGTKLAARSALNKADVVFCGGRSLYNNTRETRTHNTHLFPSGVEPEHYASAIELRNSRTRAQRPVAGYVGVIDERLDFDLIAGIAEQLPDWCIRMVGPTAKVDPDSLPQRENIEWVGPCDYKQLPNTMAGFDVALMPFALNEATKSISPTKTLEYLAAGLPVVSTRVADVVADYSKVVALEDTTTGFASACRRVISDSLSDRSKDLAPLLHWHHWDSIADRMTEIIEATLEDKLEAVDLRTAEQQNVSVS